MNIKRRDFLKQSSLAGAMAIAGAGTFQSTPAGAATAGGGARPDSPVMPKGMTLLTMQSGGVYSLGVKTERGIVDVRRAARVLKSSAPTTMDQLISGGDQGLTDVVSRALAAPSGGGLVRDERKVAFGPCVTNPEKIVCVGLNYARHAKEVGQPLPKMPILFNKFNNSLNAHQGVVRVSSIPAEKFDYEAELVIVMGRKANNVSEAEAQVYARLAGSVIYTNSALRADPAVLRKNNRGQSGLWMCLSLIHTLKVRRSCCMTSIWK